MEYFTNIPEEVTIHILTRVPAESIAECKSVSKTWRNLVLQPSFSQMYFRRLSNHDSDSGKLSFLALTCGKFWNENENLHYFEFDENHETTPIERFRRINYSLPFSGNRFSGTRFVNSCNGLVYLAGYLPYPTITGFVCICNPITREYLILPQINNDSGYWMTGFGYVSSKNEYKVVQMCNNLNAECLEVYIYTLGSGNGWRNLGKFSTEYRAYLWHKSMFSNGGALYWLGSNLEMIVTFDFAKEKFCEHLSPPPLPVDYNWDNSKISVPDGFLWFGIGEEDEFYDIWQLKRKNDNHDMKEKEEHQSLGWSKMCRVDDSLLLVVTKSDCVLTSKYKCLSIYDLKASTSKRLMDFEEQFCQVYPHKNTLILLKDLGE